MSQPLSASSNLDLDPSSELSRIQESALTPPKPLPRKLTTNATIAQLRTSLALMDLDERGKKETLVKRLNAAITRASFTPSHIDPSTPATSVSIVPQMSYSRRAQPLSCFLCFDVEATCIEDKTLDYPNEIIEWPVILLRWDNDPFFTKSPPNGNNCAPASPTTTSSTAANRSIQSIQSILEKDAGRMKLGGASTSRSSSPSPLVSTTTPTLAKPMPTPTPSSSSKPTLTVPQLKVADIYHSYVRPEWQKELSGFCKALTGIEQLQVDAAPIFPEMIAHFQEWLRSHSLLDYTGGLKPTVCWVTDGPWDLRDFVPKQLHLTPLQPPLFPLSYPPFLLGGYLNLKDAFQTVFSEKWYRQNGLSGLNGNGGNALLGYVDSSRKLPQITTAGRNGGKKQVGGYVKSPGYWKTIVGMLEEIKLGGFEGRQHSGIDDATNIARIISEFARMDIILESNAKLPPAKNAKRFEWMGEKAGEVLFDKSLIR